MSYLFRAVAASPRRSYLRRPPVVPLVLLAVLATGCAAQTASPGSTPAAADAGLVDSLVAATAPGRPLHVTFDWAMTDRDARFSGKGVVRVAPPYRARLDLFGPRGETYVIAVMTGEQLELRPEGATQLLPPAPFLWASLGVFREPAQPLSSSRTDGAAAELAFTDQAERWRFGFDGRNLRQVEWLGPDNGRRTVDLEGQSAPGLPQRGNYRDWIAFRELTLTVTGVENVDGFDAEIWTFGAR